MMENERKNEEEIGKGVNNYAKFTSLGFQMIAIIGGLTYAGYKIDEACSHQTKWVTAIFSLTGVFISLYVVIRSVKN